MDSFVLRGTRTARIWIVLSYEEPGLQEYVDSFVLRGTRAARIWIVLSYEEPGLQESEYNKFRTISSKVSSFVDNPVFQVSSVHQFQIFHSSPTSAEPRGFVYITTSWLYPMYKCKTKLKNDKKVQSDDSYRHTSYNYILFKLQFKIVYFQFLTLEIIFLIVAFLVCSYITNFILYIYLGNPALPKIIY